MYVCMRAYISWAYCIPAYLSGMLFLCQEYSDRLKQLFFNLKSQHLCYLPVLDSRQLLPLWFYSQTSPSLFPLYLVKTSLKQFLYCVVNNFLQVTAPPPPLNINSLRVGSMCVSVHLHTDAGTQWAPNVLFKLFCRDLIKCVPQGLKKNFGSWAGILWVTQVIPPLAAPQLQGYWGLSPMGSLGTHPSFPFQGRQTGRA